MIRRALAVTFLIFLVVAAWSTNVMSWSLQFAGPALLIGAALVAVWTILTPWEEKV
jgi:hypothetical protein